MLIALNYLTPNTCQDLIWMKDSPFLVIHMIVVNFLMLISQWSLLHKHAYNIDSLRPSDAIWRHRSRSTLAQVMACCLMAPSHYQNQCWLIFSKVQWHPLEGNCTKIAQSLITKINNLKFHSNLPVDNELKYIFRPWQHWQVILLHWNNSWACNSKWNI